MLSWGLNLGLAGSGSRPTTKTATRRLDAYQQQRRAGAGVGSTANLDSYEFVSDRYRFQVRLPELDQTFILDLPVDAPSAEQVLSVQGYAGGVITTGWSAVTDLIDLGSALRWDRVYSADGGGAAIGTGGARTIREGKARRIDGVTVALDASDTGTLTITIAAAGVTQHTGTATISAASEDSLSISWDTGDGTVEADETITVERTSGFSTATILTAQLHGVEA